MSAAPDRLAVSFHFDFSCPYAYLASTEIEAVARRTQAELRVRPFLLGGVFRAREVPQNLASTLSPAKALHNVRDMQRGAELRGVPMAMPARHPLRTVLALRVLLAHQRTLAEFDPAQARHGSGLWPLIHAIYRAYWVDGVDISQPEELAAVLRGLGLSAESLLAAAQTPEIKQELRDRTDEAIALGIFGAPAMVVRGTGPFGQDPMGDKLFWGHDRLRFVERALGGIPADLMPRYDGPPVDVWFDYSSPFTYLGVARARSFLGNRLRWRPMLLGAVFKALDGPDVPLQTYSPAKQAWIAADLAWQAQEAGVPLNWPSRFPVRTVLPLRVTLLALDRHPAQAERLIHRFFRAVWVEDMDPADPSEIARCCDEVGLPGADLVAAAGEPEHKRALFAATEAAVKAGVFGAPTFIVSPDSPNPSLFWGNDRLPLAAACS